jgi:hypothetical protein
LFEVSPVGEGVWKNLFDVCSDDDFVVEHAVVHGSGRALSAVTKGVTERCGNRGCVLLLAALVTVGEGSMIGPTRFRRFGKTQKVSDGIVDFQASGSRNNDGSGHDELIDAVVAGAQNAAAC